MVSEEENSIMHKSHSKPSLAEEAAAAAKAAAAAAADVAQTSREILTSKTEGGIWVEFCLFYCMNLYPKYLSPYYLFFFFFLFLSPRVSWLMVNSLQS